MRDVPGPVERGLEAALGPVFDAAEKVGKRTVPALEAMERHTPGGIPVLVWVVVPLVSMLAALALHALMN